MRRFYSVARIVVALVAFVLFVGCANEECGVWGYLTYDDGTPAVGVSVSDGFSVVRTNRKGRYHFKQGVHKDTYYIYYSLPSEAKVVENEDNLVDIFKRYSPEVNRYDFSLTKGEKEEAFSLFLVADTHGSRPLYIERVEQDCIRGIREEVAEKDIPCYTILLGDIVCAGTSTSPEEYNQPTYMRTMREMFASENTGGVPTFYVMGNHDHDRRYFDNPPTTDYKEFNFGVQRPYEECYGPVNYSFDRGETHIVCMKNVMWPAKSIENKRSAWGFCGFMDEQVEWLRQDLANVPKRKKVVLCVHSAMAPFYAASTDEKYPNVKRVVDMIARYNEPHIFSGHSHKNRDVKANSPFFGYGCPVSDKTVVGNWGHTEVKCLGDGTPLGIDIYDICGADFARHYFKDCTITEGQDVEDGYQMRAYLSNDIYGGDLTGDGKVYTQKGHLSHERYFRFYHTSNEEFLYVNVLNGSPDTWRVKLYVGGECVEELNWMSENRAGAWVKNPSPFKFEWQGNGTSTFSEPWYPSDAGNSQDWWVVAYVINEDEAVSAQTSNSSCHHMWRCPLTAEWLAAIERGDFYIEATHSEFGEVKNYKTTRIFDNDDYNDYVKP